MIDDLKTYRNEVNERARELQEIIPEVMTPQDLCYWVTALLQTAADLGACGSLDEEGMHGILQVFMENAVQMHNETNREHIH